jgi:hypothetical protein
VIDLVTECVLATLDGSLPVREHPVVAGLNLDLHPSPR